MSGLLLYALSAAHSSAWGYEPAMRLPTTDKVVALTFDDGPDPDYTQQIVDTLVAEGVPGTFFVIGEKVVADAGATDYRGMLVCSHSYSHEHMGAMTAAEQLEEMEEGERCLPPSGTACEGLWRAPRGDISNGALLWAELQGRYLGWSLTYDKVVRYPANSAGIKEPMPHEDRVRAVIDAVRPGEIILMHDGNFMAPLLAEDLADIIRGLKADGYRFTTPNEFWPAEVAAEE